MVQYVRILKQYATEPVDATAAPRIARVGDIAKSIKKIQRGFRPRADRYFLFQDERDSLCHNVRSRRVRRCPGWHQEHRRSRSKFLIIAARRIGSSRRRDVRPALACAMALRIAGATGAVSSLKKFIYKVPKDLELPKPFSGALARPAPRKELERLVVRRASLVNEIVDALLARCQLRPLPNMRIRASSLADVASWLPSVPRNGHRGPPSVQPQATLFALLVRPHLGLLARPPRARRPLPPRAAGLRLALARSRSSRTRGLPRGPATRATALAGLAMSSRRRCRFSMAAGSFPQAETLNISPTLISFASDACLRRSSQVRDKSHCS